MSPFLSAFFTLDNILKVYVWQHVSILHFYGRIMFCYIDIHIPFILFVYISWALINDVAMEICVKVCFQFHGYILGNGIPESYSNSMFYYLRNCQIAFQIPALIYITTKKLWGFKILCNHTNNRHCHLFLF